MSKASHDKNTHGGEPGADQQTPRLDRQNTGHGSGTQNHGENQGREGGRGSGRNGQREKGDAHRSPRK